MCAFPYERHSGISSLGMVSLSNRTHFVCKGCEESEWAVQVYWNSLNFKASIAIVIV
jgi:hypothetical protein